MTTKTVSKEVVKDLLKKFEEKAPEIVFEWHDAETGAEGWVVINSLRGGAAGGGTRMRKGLNKREVESLAKTMEVKFTVSGPPIGGAKSGINFDPADPRKEEVLRRWYKAVFPLLKNYYGTGGDLNVDEIHEVIPITESYGLWHPQEGIVNGHFQPTKPVKIKKIGNLRQGVSKVIEDPRFTPSTGKKYTVADMITGYGVAEAVRHFYDLWGGEIQGKRAIIQGWGNVGAAAALYLAEMGVRIVGIIDKDNGLLAPDGLSPERVKELFVQRKGNALVAADMIPFAEANAHIWDIGAEVFVPAAASRLVQKEHLDRMIAAGVEVISCGANVPFADEEIFYGPIAQYADERVSVIPDFIANCGMARVFAYLMTYEDEVLTDEAIFADTSQTIRQALERIREQQDKPTELSAKAFEIALQKLL
ncbi:MAG: amino acid dehydrogenase [Thermonema sp.]|uniref:Glu/Leu/Phe/Val dehydrogenase dimerization domain-containing protein n=1 Tax=Thermonema sp. TaxID=2231181 RepID=UPI0021DDF28D|nr:Glu/Leu/Phe/Val dehydrogenase dimerization domain-containing protein [Thermonema sp.]GIV38520.1 MAG: amino acid dehydrogenase [Thermonema sp.]